MKLFKFLRNTNPVNNIQNITIRGPKKKSDKKDMVKSEHILNFYKNADDVVILPDEYYPKWVLELHEFRYNVDETLNNAIAGHLIPPTQHMHTIFRSIKRRQMKLNNYAKAENVMWDTRLDKKLLKKDEEEDLLDDELPGLSEDEEGYEEGMEEGK
jgi:hypothetical protein